MDTNREKVSSEINNGIQCYKTALKYIHSFKTNRVFLNLT